MNASLTATTTTAILVFCYLPASFGSNADDHFTLSLKDLLDIEASVASKIELPLSFSPATIKVYSREDFINLGVHQLADLADISAGYASYSSFENNKLEMLKGPARFIAITTIL